MRAIALLAFSSGLGGCYQTLGAAYVHRFADSGGSSFQGHYLIAFGEVIGDDEPTVFGKAEVAGGPWGLRGADVFGVMALQDLGDASFFLRPGLALFVIGAETRERDEELWFGIGAELEVGFLVPFGEDAAFEIGVHSGADLSYTGTGTGGFVGAFIGFGWASDGPDIVTR